MEIRKVRETHTGYKIVSNVPIDGLYILNYIENENSFSIKKHDKGKEFKQRGNKYFFFFNTTSNIELGKFESTIIDNYIYLDRETGTSKVR